MTAKQSSPPEIGLESIELFGGDGSDTSLLDLIDNVLNHGVVLQGELILGVANVDLVYAKLSVLLAAVDRLSDSPASEGEAVPARRARRRRAPRGK